MLQTQPGSQFGLNSRPRKLHDGIASQFDPLQSLDGQQVLQFFLLGDAVALQIEAPQSRMEHQLRQSGDAVKPHEQALERRKRRQPREVTQARVNDR